MDAAQLCTVCHFVAQLHHLRDGYGYVEGLRTVCHLFAQLHHLRDGYGYVEGLRLFIISHGVNTAKETNLKFAML